MRLRTTDAIALGTLSLVEDELEHGKLRVVPFSARWLRMNAGFITVKGLAPPPAAVAFTEIVRGVEKALAERELEPRDRFCTAATQWS